MRMFNLVPAICVLCCAFASTSVADVSVRGDVSPTPNSAGGTIAGALTVGVGLPNGTTLLGTMSIDDGTTLGTGDVTIGDRAGAHGIAEVRQPRSRWTSTDDFVVGNHGYGELFVSEEGWVGNVDDFGIGFFNDGLGWVNVDGVATMLNVGDALNVGVAGTGNLIARNRSRVVSASGVIGLEPNGAGFTTVTDSASWRVRTRLTVGNLGSGSLIIGSGGVVENLVGVVAAQSTAPGHVSVSGHGSLWLNRDDLIVGDRGPGTVRVSDSGSVQVIDSLVIRRRGELLLSSGRISANSIGNDGVIEGSGQVRGTLNNTANGSIRANQLETLAFRDVVTNGGAIDSIGGRIEFDRAVTNSATGTIVGRNGVFRFDEGLTNNGTLGFSLGGTDIFGAVNNTATGTIHVGGEGTATFYGNVRNAGSIITEPESTVFFVGNLTVAANARVGLAGLAEDPKPSGEPSVDDPLNVTGQLQLDGSLALSPSRNPQAVVEPTERGKAVTLSVLTASNLTGTFAGVTYDSQVLSKDFAIPNADERSFRSYDPSADALGTFRSIIYDANSIKLVNYLAIPGDTNGDRDVDFSDFLTLADHFGGPGDWPQGDFDGNGSVLFPDFLALADNFGASTAAVQSVPEPASSMLGFWMLTLFLCRRRAAARRCPSPVLPD